MDKTRYDIRVYHSNSSESPFTKEPTIQEIDAQINNLQEMRKRALAKELKGKTVGMFYVVACNAQVAQLYMTYLGKKRHEWKYVSSPEMLRGLTSPTVMIVGDRETIKGYSAIVHDTRMRKGTLLYLNDR